MGRLVGRQVGRHARIYIASSEPVEGWLQKLAFNFAMIVKNLNGRGMILLLWLAEEIEQAMGILIRLLPENGLTEDTGDPEN